MIGDIVVTIDPSSTAGVCGQYVLECKDRHLGLKAVLDELGKASANRDTHAAIAVFSHPEHAPVPDPFTVFDDRAIVVYDKDNPDPAALRLACAWARWITQRDSHPEHRPIDAAQVHSLVEEARQAVGRRTVIRRAHSAAAKRIQEAAGHVDELHDNIADLIDRIEHSITPP